MSCTCHYCQSKQNAKLIQLLGITNSPKTVFTLEEVTTVLSKILIDNQQMSARLEKLEKKDQNNVKKNIQLYLQNQQRTITFSEWKDQISVSIEQFYEMESEKILTLIQSQCKSILMSYVSAGTLHKIPLCAFTEKKNTVYIYVQKPQQKEEEKESTTIQEYYWKVLTADDIGALLTEIHIKYNNLFNEWYSTHKEELKYNDKYKIRYNKFSENFTSVDLFNKTKYAQFIKIIYTSIHEPVQNVLVSSDIVF